MKAYLTLKTFFVGLLLGIVWPTWGATPDKVAFSGGDKVAQSIRYDAWSSELVAKTVLTDDLEGCYVSEVADVSKLVPTPSGISGGGCFYEWTGADGSVSAIDNGEIYRLQANDVDKEMYLNVNAGNLLVALSVQELGLSVTIEGEAVLGGTLRAVVPDELSNFDCVWERGSNRVGAGPNYKPTPEDVEKEIRLTVTAGGYSGGASVWITKAKLQGTVTIAPTPEPVAGNTLTATCTGCSESSSPGVSPAELTYEWWCGGEMVFYSSVSSDIGSSSSAYTLKSEDVGKSIYVMVTAFNLDSVLRSVPTIEVRKAKLAGTVEIVVNGEAATVGRALKVDTSKGKSDPPGVIPEGYTITWKRGEEKIATGMTYTPNQADAGESLTVTASAANLDSSITSVPVPVSKAKLTGKVDIEGEIKGERIVGNPLSVNPTGLSSDPSYVPPGAYTYRWQIDDSKYSYDATYTPEQEDVGKRLIVEVWTDNLRDTVVSTPKEVKKALLSGVASIIGEAVVGGGELWVDVNELLPLELLHGSSYRYEWRVNGQPAVGGGESTYTPVREDAGKQLTVAVWADNLRDSVVSAPKEVKKALLGGKVSITGLPAVVGKELVVDTSKLEKQSGIPSGGYSYVWSCSDEPINGATGKTYTPSPSDTGCMLTVSVSAGNLQGTITSTEYVKVGKASLKGNVTISGDSAVGGQLEANTEGLYSDPSVGYGKLAYTWYRDGEPISNTNSKKYQLVQEDVGKEISVWVSAAGLTGNVVSSRLVKAVKAKLLRVTVSVTGRDTVGGTLSVVVTGLLSEPGGILPGDTLYQWLCDNVPIRDANGKSYRSYRLRQEHAGKKISVRVSTSNLEGAENSPQKTINKARLMGKVTVDGKAIVMQLLNATIEPFSTPANVDPGEYTYTWWSGNQKLHTGSSYMPEDKDAEKEIIVKVYAANLQDTIRSKPVTVSKAQLAGTVEISGEAIVGGDELKVNNDVFTVPPKATPGEYSYVWRRNKDGKTVDVGTAPTYTPTLQDMDCNLTVEVSAANLSGSVVSQPVVVKKASLLGSISIENTINAGKGAMVGKQLEVDTSKLKASTSEAVSGGYIYTWQFDGEPPVTTNTSVYTPNLADTGKNLFVKVSAKNLQGVISAPNYLVITKANLDGKVKIIGKTTVGSLLSVDTSELKSNPQNVPPGAYRYEWRWNGTTNVLLATGNSYTPTLADTGKMLIVKIRAANLNDDFNTVSDTVRKAQLEGNVLVDGIPAIVSRQLEVNTTGLYSTPLGADIGEYLYEWRRGSEEQPVSYEKTYMPTQDDVGKIFTVKVRARNLSGVRVFTSTEAVNLARIQGGKVTVASAGKNRDTVGNLLEVTAVELYTDPPNIPPDDTLYQWYRGKGELIDGATGRQYRLVPADAVGNIIVKVQASNLQGSVPSTRIDVNKAMLRGTVRIVGVDTVGYTLEADTNSLKSYPPDVPFGEVQYRWERNGKPIEGATGQQYPLVPADTGVRISVTVMAVNLEGSITSDTTGIISDKSYCGNGVKNEDCPAYPDFHKPGNGGDTGYCGNGIINIECPDYPGYTPDRLIVDTLTLKYAVDSTYPLSSLLRRNMSGGRWLSRNETVVTVRGDNIAFVEGAGTTHLLYYLSNRNSDYNEVWLSVLVRVEQWPLSIEQPSLPTVKRHDGGVTVEFVQAGSLTGCLPQDKNRVSVQATATYESPDIGANIPITVVYELTGDRAHCYKAPLPDTELGSIVGKSDNVPGYLYGKVLRIEVSESGDTTYVPWDSLAVGYRIQRGAVIQKEEQVLTSNGVYFASNLDVEAGNQVYVIPPHVPTYILLTQSPISVPVSDVMKVPTTIYLQETITIAELTFRDEKGKELDHWERGEIHISGDTVFYHAPCGVEQLEVMYNIPASGVVGRLMNSPGAEELDNGGFRIRLDAFEQKVVTLQLVSTTSYYSPPLKRYTFMLEKDFGLFDIVTEHIGSIRMVNNNPKYNRHQMTFDSCTWYLKQPKDSTFHIVEKEKLYYMCENNIYRRFVSTDSMKLVLYTAGKVIETCPDARDEADGGIVAAYGKQQSGLSIYPNPVSPGGVVRLKRDDFVDSEEYILSAKCYLFDGQGRLVRASSASTLYEGLTMPESPGIYHLVLETADGRRKSVKIAVGAGQ
jgi:hypothetical protein